MPKIVEHFTPAPRAFEIYLGVCHRGGTLQEAYNQMMEEGFVEDAQHMVDTIQELRHTETLH